MTRGTAGVKSGKTTVLTDASSVRRNARAVPSSDHQYPVSLRPNTSSQ
jgi:hypothetical protein